ncbi:MAG: AsmA protein [Pseudohongiellaceae bacterium]|jgi:AsmA protein
MIKTLIKFIASLVAIVVVLAAGLLFFIDTNQYRAALEAAVANSTGFELTIAGDLELKFFPALGLTLNDVRLRNPASSQELASTSAITLQVDRGSLINGEIKIQQFSADDFHVNYTVDEAGKSLWQIQGLESAAEPDEAARGGTSVTASFDSIAISNASIDYQDLSTASRFSLSNVDLESSGANIDGRPFGLNLSYDFVTYSADTGLASPVPMSFRSIISANLDQGEIDVREFNFTLTPVLLQGQIKIENLNTSPTVSGNLKSDQIDILALMDTLSLSDEPNNLSTTARPPRLSLSTSFNGNENQIVLSQFTGRLGETQFDGDASIRLATEFTPINISYNLSSTALDLTPFMAIGQAPTPASQTPNTSLAGQATDTVLPIELLSSFDLIGSVAIESIKFDEFLFESVNAYTNIESSVLDIELQPVTAFGGTIAGNLRVDGRSAEAPMTTQLNLSRLNLVELAPSVSRLNSATGRLNSVSSYSANAATVNTLTNTLSGSTQFAIADNSVDITLLKQIFTTISALSPAGGSRVQSWPNTVQFRELAGNIVVNNGISEGQLLNLKMDNFVMDGTGGVNLDEGSFDYQMAFTLLGPPELQTFPIGDLYHGVQWPIICSSTFDSTVSQYCNPDFTRVREIFTQIGANALRNGLQEKITEQVPEELKDTARGLLRNILN